MPSRLSQRFRQTLDLGFCSEMAVVDMNARPIFLIIRSVTKSSILCSN